MIENETDFSMIISFYNHITSSKNYLSGNGVGSQMLFVCSYVKWSFYSLIVVYRLKRIIRFWCEIHSREHSHLRRDIRFV